VSGGAPVSDVRTFWEEHPVGVHLVDEALDSAWFFDAYRSYRYRTEWHIRELVPFASAVGQRVLEIGCGMGADGSCFAEAGARYVAVDLTETALTASRRHFRGVGLEGGFVRGSGEDLPFADGSFDLVYSHGVLHHTPRTERAFDEVHRVLRPGGRFVVMLYHRHSFNYYVRIMLAMRAAVLGYTAARRLGFARPAPVASTRERHYAMVERHGWSYFRAREFVNHCTDGPECPIARAYSRRQVAQMLGRFEDVRFAVAHFPLRKSLAWVPLGVERVLARTMGWYLFAYARKRAGAA